MLETQQEDPKTGNQVFLSLLYLAIIFLLLYVLFFVPALLVNHGVYPSGAVKDFGCGDRKFAANIGVKDTHTHTHTPTHTHTHTDIYTHFFSSLFSLYVCCV